MPMEINLGLKAFDQSTFDHDLIDQFQYFLMLVNEPGFSFEELVNSLSLFEANIQIWHEESEFFDFELAENLLNISKYLINSFNQFTSAQQKEIEAAILYLVQEDDSKKDSLFMGLEDDKEIFRYVLQKNNIEI